jgi:2-polyprenyl-3-methyl-5-hydroxy-6-metoxy-1,4-benzoquinol methylase
MKETAFWNNRVKKYGHTGWSDFATYYYDQNLRLNAINNLIRKYGINDTLALDYGCGTGDFSKMMSQYFENIIAVDISEEIINKAKLTNRNYKIKFKMIDKKIFTFKYNLIICITVLQHIKNDDELNELINNFNLSLNGNGIVIILESFSKEVDENNYTKLRNADFIKNMFSKCGFKLINFYNFYHPLYHPTHLFKNYRKSFFVIILNMLCSYKFPFSKLLLYKIAKVISDKDNGIVETESITKILLFKK